MSDPSQTRKLATMLAADVAGYSRLMGDDDEATVRTLTEYRQVFTDHIARHQGRVIDTAGDSVLATFDSVVEAVVCSTEIQKELTRRNRQLAEYRRMAFRIGLNVGDVITREDGSIYGDGVNIAARLQAIAEPGEICISGNVHEQVESRLELSFADIGEQQVKNIDKPVRAYKILTDTSIDKFRKVQRSKRRAVAISAAVIVAVVVSCGVLWNVQKPTTEQATKATDPALAMPTGPTVAVLPFTNMSGDLKQEYFSDGITEEIITELARFRDLFVVARNSTFRYKGQALDVRQVGRELSAKYVLEGSVRREADRIRVTAQLLNAQTGAHLWAETYERELTAGAIFAIQDEITSQVVGAIGGAFGEISHATWQQSKARGPASLDSYECVLVFNEYSSTNAEKDHLRARECLERAVKVSPNYAEAWAVLAMVYGEEHMFGYNLRADPIGRAFRAAQRAIELDPANQRAQESLANVYFYQHDVNAVIAQAERAVALNPNHAETIANMGLYMVYIGMNNPTIRKRGLALVKKAIALSTHHPGWYHFPTAWAHWWTGEYERGLAEANLVNQPDLFWTYVTLAMIHGGLGQGAKAAPSVAQIARLYPTFSAHARDEFHKWNLPEAFIDRAVDNLRKTGLAIPDVQNSESMTPERKLGTTG
jgi:adenylate cyclase